MFIVLRIKMKNETRQQVGVFLKNTCQFFVQFLLYALFRGLGQNSLSEFGWHVFNSLMIVGTLIIFSSLVFYLIVQAHSFKLNYIMVITCLIIMIAIFEVFFITRGSRAFF